MAYQSEIEKLEQRFKEKPEQWFAALADAYRKAGDLDLALDLVKTWSEKRPNYTSGLIVLGRCLVDKEQDSEAAQAFERVLELDAENIIALRSLSEIAIRHSDHAGARQWMERLLDVDPMNEEARALLDELALAPAQAEGPPAEEPAAPEAPAVEVGGEAAPAAGVGQQVPGLVTGDVKPPEAPPPAGFEPTVRPAGPSSPAEEEGDIEIEYAAGARPDDRTVEMEPIELETSQEAALPGTGAEPAGEAPEGDLNLVPFDEELTWDAGDRMSKQITDDVLEEAAHVHEESVAPPAQQLPGLEQTEVPDIGHHAEPETAVGEGAPSEPPGPRDREPADAEPAGAGTLAGPAGPPDVRAAAPRAAAEEDADEGEVELPLILPEEIPGAEPGGADVEPVVTETMAQLYARQGLYAKAMEIYRKLAQERPDDATLAGRAEEMKAAARSARERPAAARARYSVEETGGPSARAFLKRVLAARPGAAGPGAPPAAAPRVSGRGEQAGDAELLEDVFTDGGGFASGAPAREAEEEISLSSVFGEDEEGVDEPRGPADRGSKPRRGPAPEEPGSGFSFDQFFGAGPGGAGGAPGPADAGEPGGDEDDDFQDWLKGLKS